MASVAATVAIMAVAGLVVFELRASVGARARESAANVLRLTERDIEQSIKVLDLSLNTLVDGLKIPDVMGLPPQLRRLVLFERAGVALGLGEIVAFDAEGRIAHDATYDVPRSIEPVTDRDYFQVQRDRKVDGLFISRAYRSRLLGRDVIGLSRAISKPDGGFDGVALATIEVSRLEAVLRQLDLGPRGVVTLVRHDGAILLRVGAGTTGPVADITGSAVLARFLAEPNGTFELKSPVDGVGRVTTFMRVGDLPLTIAVGLASDDIYRDATRQAVMVVVVLGLICIGIIVLMSKLTTEVSRRAAMETALRASNVELARLSTTDALTRLGNRRAFDETLSRELKRARRSRRRLSLILFDVDHFKRFNDTYGHPEGDTVLSDVGLILGSSGSRPADLAFRVGGEEFAMVLPETDLGGATAVAERVRDAVRALNRAHSASALGIVTVSAGVAEVQNLDPSTAYMDADAALYRAKRAGRDRVQVGSTQPLAA